MLNKFSDGRFSDIREDSFRAGGASNVSVQLITNCIRTASFKTRITRERDDIFLYDKLHKTRGIFILARVARRQRYFFLDAEIFALRERWR